MCGRAPSALQASTLSVFSRYYGDSSDVDPFPLVQMPAPRLQDECRLGFACSLARSVSRRSGECKLALKHTASVDDREGVARCGSGHEGHVGYQEPAPAPRAMLASDVSLGLGEADRSPGQMLGLKARGLAGLAWAWAWAWALRW